MASGRASSPASVRPTSSPVATLRRGDRRSRAYPQDVYEEVLRHWGFDRVPATLPRLTGVDEGSSPAWDRRLRVQDLLAGLGLAEGIHFAFHSREADKTLPALGTGDALALANPLSERYAVLRRSLVPNLLAAAEYNLNRGASAVGLFEVGRLFPGEGEEEMEAVAVLLGGKAGSPWDRHAEQDLFDLKGVLAALFAELGVVCASEPTEELSGVLAGTGGWLLQGVERIGWFGRLERDEPAPALFAGEIWLDRLRGTQARRAVAPPPRFPGVEVDLTLAHPLAVAWSEIAMMIERDQGEDLAGFELKDRYQGKGVPSGSVATTITFRYQAADRSLSQDEVNARHARLAAQLEQRYGVARED